MAVRVTPPPAPHPRPSRNSLSTSIKFRACGDDSFLFQSACKCIRISGTSSLIGTNASSGWCVAYSKSGTNDTFSSAASIAMHDSSVSIVFIFGCNLLLRKTAETSLPWCSYSPIDNTG